MKRLTEDGEIVDINCEDCVIGVMPFWKTPHNHNTNNESDRTATTCKETSLTDQSFKQEADINFIMEQYGKGKAPNIVLPEHFGDAFAIPTLLEARTRIAQNNATFHSLAPEIREEFLNDPARWEERVIKDVADGNLDDLERMGIDMTQVRERMAEYDKAVTDRQARQDEKQLTELQEKLAKRAAATQGGTPAPGGHAGEGGTPVPPTTRRD